MNLHLLSYDNPAFDKLAPCVNDGEFVSKLYLLFNELEAILLNGHPINEGEWMNICNLFKTLCKLGKNAPLRSDFVKRTGLDGQSAARRIIRIRLHPNLRARVAFLDSKLGLLYELRLLQFRAENVRTGKRVRVG